MNTFDAIVKRKRIHNFSDKQISKNQLKTLIHATNSAAIIFILCNCI